MKDYEIGLITALCAIFATEEWKSCNRDARKRVIEYFSARANAEISPPAAFLTCTGSPSDILGPLK